MAVNFAELNKIYDMQIQTSDFHWPNSVCFSVSSVIHFGRYTCIRFTQWHSLGVKG